MFDLRLERIKQQNSGYWSTRILSQLEYGHELSKISDRMYDGLIDKTIVFLAKRNERDGAITRESACEAEQMVIPLSANAKCYNVVCAAHAHIDMNWMWRWDETVAVTLDTFRTMLNLMKEYPDFKFSQSQASVYQIVETYDPEMLDEIRSRVKEGRWEVTASTWVEADKNLPNGESQARHLLYTRRYLSQLLDLKPDAFQLDFEPDTFGHHANVPEILASGGVRYYYHCRGDKTHYLYRWAAPSGRSILVYLEPLWYLGYVEPSLALYAPSFCQQHGMDTLLKVYGVGDHGGGPTRRDVERIRDMATWPVFPVIRFGGFKDYFTQVERVADRLPVVTGELNFVFTGCYTSQSRIKKANRLAEAALDSAETFCAAAAIKGKPYPVDRFAKAWQNTLFNQFHDIIPGSGVIDTREYALGLFQETMAHASSLKSRAFSALTKQNGRPAVVEEDLVASIAEGAGVGFGIEDFKPSQVSRGGRKERLFHICNPSPWPRQQVVEVIVWDWDGDLQRLAFKNTSGQLIRHQVLDRGWNNYWGHKYLRALVEVEAPPCGYTTVVLTETDAILDSLTFPLDPRTEEPENLRLENERLLAIFDRQSCTLVSLVDKASGAELIDPENPCVFRRVQEDDRVGGTAWTVGRYMSVQNLGEGARLLKLDISGALRQSFSYEIVTGPSKLTVTASLDAGSDHLDYAVECDWHEIGRKGQGVPQLNFHLPVAYACQAYRYDIPFATVDRPSGALDTPANSWGAAIPQGQDKPVIQLITEGNYGFRGVDDSLGLTLIRSSYDPDPYPEIGIHKIHFAIRVNKPAPANRDLIASAYDYTHRLDVYSGGNTQPDRFSFLRLERGSVMVSALKTPEDGARDELIVRLYETDGQETPVELCFDQPIARAAWVNTHEQPVTASQPLVADGQQLSFTVEANRLVTVRIKFYS